MNQSKLLELFPYDTPRPGQIESVESILEAFESGKKFAILEGPTGCGKSAIGMTLAQAMKEKTFYITVQKMLQTQLIKDFGHMAIDLKGRNTYECSGYRRMHGILSKDPDHEFWAKNDKRYPSKEAKAAFLHRILAFKQKRCHEGFCKMMCGKSNLSDCGMLCAYWRQRVRAQTSKICIMNFHSYLYQMMANFGARELLIIDEAHNLEGVLLDIISLSISSKKLPIILPKLKNPEQYKEFFEQNKVGLIIRTKLEEARSKDEPRASEVDHWEGLAKKYTHFMIEANNLEWVAEYKKHETHQVVTLKPIYIDRYTDEKIFNFADKILLMSATILDVDVICQSLGIDRNQVYAKRLGSRFPVGNRPIFHRPVGPLTKKKKEQTFPRLIKMVDRICESHKGQRGIIHTHNFEISNLLLDNCKSNDRFLFQKDFYNKTEMLETHSNSEDSIIVAPAMHEGLDLFDGLSRFQIICKVPYPPLGDKQIKTRLDLDDGFYQWLTATAIVQAYGRSVRSESDWADTYILDSEFKNFFHRHRSKLPGWFQEAIKWGNGD